MFDVVLRHRVSAARRDGRRVYGHRLGHVFCCGGFAVEGQLSCGRARLQKRLDVWLRGVDGRVGSCSLRLIRIGIGWIGVVSENAENSRPKAEEKWYEK